MNYLVIVSHGLYDVAADLWAAPCLGVSSELRRGGSGDVPSCEAPAGRHA